MQPPENRMMTAGEVKNYFGGISDMTLWRWLKDQDLSFPQPIRIQKRRYWHGKEIEEFRARLAQVGAGHAA